MGDDAVRLAEMRISVAFEKKLPDGMSKRLRGNTRAELEADADTLASHFQPAESEPATMSDRIRAATGRQASTAVSADADATVTLDGGARRSTKPPLDVNEWIRERTGR